MAAWTRRPSPDRAGVSRFSKGGASRSPGQEGVVKQQGREALLGFFFFFLMTKPPSLWGWDHLREKRVEMMEEGGGGGGVGLSGRA